MRTLAALGLLAVVLAASACGGEGDAAGQGTVTVALAELTASGQSGTARLTPVGDDRTNVEIEVTSPPAFEQPAHIHPGSCADLDPLPAYPLTPVARGVSRTTVAASVDELLDGTFAVNVHLSEQEIRTSVACGDIG